MTLTNYRLFNIIEQSKKQRMYTIANAAFVILVDRALDSDCFTFEWEADPQAEDRSEIYYDLLTLRLCGLWSACIPAPLLKRPLLFREICLEVEKKEHRREFVRGTSSRAFAKELLKEKNLKRLLQKYLVRQNASEAKSFNIGKVDCLCCKNYNGEQGTCAVLDSYPINDKGFCQQWQLG